MNKKETCNGMPAYEGPLSKNQSLAQSELEFNPDWDAMAVMVEEQQRMAKRIEELTQLVTSQGIRLMDAEAQPEPEPVAYINVQDRKLEWAKLTKWETPTVVKMDKVPLYTAPPLPDYNIKLERMRELVKIQGNNGNWNYDPYMHGMYNGMEFMIAMLEDREPVFKSTPEK